MNRGRGTDGERCEGCAAAVCLVRELAGTLGATPRIRENMTKRHEQRRRGFRGAAGVARVRPREAGRAESIHRAPID